MSAKATVPSSPAIFVARARSISYTPTRRTSLEAGQVPGVVLPQRAHPEDADRQPCASRRHASLARLDECQEALYLGERRQLGAGSLHRLRHVQIGIEEEPVRPLERGDGFAREARPLEARAS